MFRHFECKTGSIKNVNTIHQLIIDEMKEKNFKVGFNTDIDTYYMREKLDATK